VVYTVSLEELLPTINRVIDEVTPRGLYEAVRALSYRGVEIMMDESPSSLKSGRGYRGPPMRFSIEALDQSTPDEAVFVVTPTKMVDGYRLADILENGSPGGKKIIPVGAKMLKFIGTNAFAGRVMFKGVVTRGTIPPQRFAERTKRRIENEASDILQRVIINEYMKDVGGVG